MVICTKARARYKFPEVPQQTAPVAGLCRPRAVLPPSAGSSIILYSGWTDDVVPQRSGLSSNRLKPWRSFYKSSAAVHLTIFVVLSWPFGWKHLPAAAGLRSHWCHLRHFTL